jgi:hypothetical protein
VHASQISIKSNPTDPRAAHVLRLTKRPNIIADKGSSREPCQSYCQQAVIGDVLLLA